MTCRRLLTCALLSLSFVATGCSIWDSATSYFNTYYNARRLFQEAEDEIWSQPDLRYSGHDLLAPIGPAQGARTKLSSVIEKGSKLLQYHPSSALVDEALLMIGKSFYYQGEYQRAERKFKELIDAYGEEGTAIEARLWLACTYFRLNDPAESERLARIIMDNRDADDASRSRAALLLARIESANRDLQRARQYFVFGAERADNGDLEAGAWLSVASLDSAAGNPASAEAMYRNALAASKNYVSEYRARLGIARARAMQGEGPEALDLLRELRASQNYREFFGEIDLEIARVYSQAGQTASAIQQYRIVDTTYVRTEWSAMASYELGGIFEHHLQNLDSARAVYSRARNTAPYSIVGRDLIKRADALSRYITYRSDLARYDSLRLIPEADTGASWARKDSLKGTKDSLRVGTGPLWTAKDTIHAAHDTLRTRKEPLRAVMDSLRAGIDSAGTVRNIVRSSAPALPRDTLDARRARTLGELANLFYTTLDIRDSAAFFYRRLLAEYPASPASARALFVLAQIASTDSGGRRETGDSLYRVILSRFPRSEFAGEVRRVLGLPAEKVATDSAEILYARAEELFLQSPAPDLKPAITTLQTVVERYPASPVAPRAMYAIGWTYEKGLALPDSALSAYRRLLAAYPSSQFATVVRPMVNEADAAAAARLAPHDSSAVAPKPANLPKMPIPGVPEGEDPEVRRGRKTQPGTPRPQPPEVPGQERPKD